MRELFRFPNPVNEVSTRLTAGAVGLMAAAVIAFHQPWILVVLAYGFIARVLAGPRLSPLALLVTRVVTPRLPVEPRYTAGPPKRFAQGIGAVVTTLAAVLWLGFDQEGAALVLATLMVVFATLESAFGLCVGCRIFGMLMKLGAVPEDVCAECANIWARPR